MKKLLFLCLIGMSFNSNAQIEKGTMLIGGSVRFNHMISENSSRTSLHFSPNAGYTVFKNFVVGGNASFNYNKDYHSWSISPYIRYYYKGAFLEGGYGFSQSVYGDYKTDYSFLNLELGYAAFLNKNVALEPALYFDRQFRMGDYQYSNFGLKLGLQIYINR